MNCGLLSVGGCCITEVGVARDEGGVAAAMNGAMVGTRQGKFGTTVAVVGVDFTASCFIIPVSKACDSGGKDHTGATTGAGPI